MTVIMLHTNGPHGVTALHKTTTHYDTRRADTEQKMAISWSRTQKAQRKTTKDIDYNKRRMDTGETNRKWQYRGLGDRRRDAKQRKI
ncbi:Hypothetical predicted protein [Paramuricea clavata]|uniref:Uncharacterized protein n=1 Tax=Paramuricea clavata TaxID=317549 RepID=A0A6S7K7H5_PARCT|nr:Hypothetical predicted protein [Paramuricea clavata]